MLTGCLHALLQYAVALCNVDFCSLVGSTYGLLYELTAVFCESRALIGSGRRRHRFNDHPLVAGGSALPIRFYAGAPLILSTGHRIGAMCATLTGSDCRLAVARRAAQVVCILQPMWCAELYAASRSPVSVSARRVPNDRKNVDICLQACWEQSGNWCRVVLECAC